MFNQGSGVQGVFEHELNEYKSVQVTRILHDFYDSDPKRGFYGGGGIDARINPQPALWAMDAGGDLPRWGRDLKERLEGFPRTMASTGHTTSLPLESNSVSIDPVLKDAWGIPAIRVTYKDHPDDMATAKFFQDRSYEIVEAAGAKKIWRDAVEENTGGVHLLGTARMGNDPATSVVDKYPPYARCAQSLPVRRFELRDVRSRTTDHDHSGAGLSCRGLHRTVRQAQRDLIRGRSCLHAVGARVSGIFSSAAASWSVSSSSCSSSSGSASKPATSSIS